MRTKKRVVELIIYQFVALKKKQLIKKTVERPHLKPKLGQYMEKKEK
jgi:hypothetical protein